MLTSRDVAYELWRLHETQSRAHPAARQPLNPLDDLIEDIRTRHPHVPQSTLAEGKNHFLESLFSQVAARVDCHRRLRGFLSPSGAVPPAVKNFAPVPDGRYNGRHIARATASNRAKRYKPPPKEPCP